MATIPQHLLSGRTIGSFRDSVGLALQLADDVAYANAIALVNPDDGAIISTMLTNAVDASLIPQLRWAWQQCLAARTAPTVSFEPQDLPTKHDATIDRPDGPVHQRRRGALLLSVRDVAHTVVRENDLITYRFAQSLLSHCEIGLVDWIQTDGEDIRSFAYLLEGRRAWSNDPPTHRRQDAAALFGRPNAVQP